MAIYTALCHVTEMKNPDKSGLITLCQIAVVRMVGLEPTRLAASEPKSGASTNFATPAKKDGGYDGIRTCDPIIMSDVL